MIKATRLRKRFPTNAERADTLNAAIDYAIEQGFEGMAWLEAWREGDIQAMVDLDEWRKKNAK